MNDEELGRVLGDHLHRRVNPPDVAPEAVHEHLRDLRLMQPVRLSGARPTRVLRDLSGLAAAVAICALIAVGLFVRPSSKPNPGVSAPKNGIEAFCRIDSKTAWAESGPDLYITRDGGETWSKGVVPGGLSPAQLFGVVSSSEAAATDIPTPVADPSAEPAATDTPAPILRLPGHYYPDFVDADHGWLLSWAPSQASSNGIDYTMTAWRTTDGGQHWASTALAGTYRGTGLVQFVDASHGWITLLRTDYQAAAVSEQAGGTGGSAPATPTPTFSIPSDATTVLATTDGGATWAKVSTLAAMALPHFVSQTEAWGYAETSLTPQTYAVIHSTDAGRTWQMSGLPLPSGGDVFGWPNPPLEANGSVTARVAYMMPGGLDFLTFVSQDGGVTWSLQSRNSDHNSTDTIVNSVASLLDLPAGQPAVMMTGDNPSAPAGLKATFDGGETWTTYSTSGLPSSGVTLAEWTSPDDVWIMTAPYIGAQFELRGQLYATHDHGKTWTPLLGAPAWPASPEPSAPAGNFATPTAPPVEVTPMITEIGRLDAKTGWVRIEDPSGADQLRFTRDGGATWSDPRKAPPGSRTQFIDLDHGWTMSFGSTEKSTSITIHRTADGGATWQDSAVTLNSRGPGDLADLYARQSGWDPRLESPPFVYLLMRPVRVQAWRESNEPEGRTITRDGEWLY
jgi:photosystem II stability/assembly factor-like uncharacterized protein